MRNPRVVVIGAGMSGLLAGIRLRDAGIDDFVILEKADRLGGTWRDNRYPGLACDVPSHVYSYSFAPNPEWSHRFSPGPEILRYLEDTAERHGVTKHLECGSEVTRCEWHGEGWRLETKDGRVLGADFVLCATGVLHHPHVPEIDGLDGFEGDWFHSARWNPEVRLDGRRVGLVGTGSTAVQIVTALTDRVDHLTLFQRTAQWVLPGRNEPYTEAERQGFRRDPAALAALRADLDTRFHDAFTGGLLDADSEGARMIQQLCTEHLETRVHDPVLRERLRPDYRAACKRLVVADGFYEAMQQPNATLVTEGIERVEPEGVRTRDGRLHPLDVLVLATGFRAHDFMRPMSVVGPGGRSLQDAWQPVPRGYRSVSVPGFPNFFTVVGPHSPIGNFSLIEISELQVDYILQLMEPVRRGECKTVAASAEATDRFNEALREATRGTIWMTGCKSWYLDAEGYPATWPWSVARFRNEMRAPDWRDFDRG